MNIDGSGYAVLHNFTGGAGDGGSPYGQLIVSGSKLYGFTDHGGSSGTGALFSMDLNGNNFTLMHSFQSFPGDGELPVGEPTVVGSTLYGTTVIGGANSLGTILGIGTDGNNYGVDYSFAGGPGDGSGPVGQLQLSGSELFGMTGQGGQFNDGTIFSFTPVPEPSSLILTAAAGGAITWAARRGRKAV